MLGPSQFDFFSNVRSGPTTSDSASENVKLKYKIAKNQRQGYIFFKMYF